MSPGSRDPSTPTRSRREANRACCQMQESDTIHDQILTPPDYLHGLCNWLAKRIFWLPTTQHRMANQPTAGAPAPREAPQPLHRHTTILVEVFPLPLKGFWGFSLHTSRYYGLGGVATSGNCNTAGLGTWDMVFLYGENFSIADYGFNHESSKQPPARRASCI